MKDWSCGIWNYIGSQLQENQFSFRFLRFCLLNHVSSDQNTDTCSLLCFHYIKVYYYFTENILKCQLIILNFIYIK